MEFSEVTWRKASYSGSNGGACVEVGVWHKSSYSNANGGACVEVFAAPELVCLVRDTKNRDGGKLAFSARAWGVFLDEVRGSF
jgi:Domain of unknown function (DUF397)